MPKRALVLLAAVSALVLGVAQPAVAGARGNNDKNQALAVNTKDGKSVFKLSISIRRTADVEVDPENVALSYASCESCQTVAIAIQVVLAVGSVATVDASNIAVAVNDECRDCQTLATAHQIVVVTGGRVRLTRVGRQEIRRVHRELRALRRTRLPPSALRDRVDRLAARLHQAVTTDLRLLKPAPTVD